MNGKTIKQLILAIGVSCFGPGDTGKLLAPPELIQTKPYTARCLE